MVQRQGDQPTDGESAVDATEVKKNSEQRDGSAIYAVG